MTTFGPRQIPAVFLKKSDDVPNFHLRNNKMFAWVRGSRITLAFSCGARSAFKLKEKGYLRNMLSRRQLQGFVRRRLLNHQLHLASMLLTHGTIDMPHE